MREGGEGVLGADGGIAMKAILKSDRKTILDVEPLCQWFYLTEHRTEYTYSDKEGKVYRDNEIELVEYQGG